MSIRRPGIFNDELEDAVGIVLAPAAVSGAITGSGLFAGS